MAPNNTITTPTQPLFENESTHNKNLGPAFTEKRKDTYVRQIVWTNVVIYALFHIGAVYGFYLALTSAKWMTVIFAILLYQVITLGITAGAHRLWSHKSYKATWQLRLILIFLNTIAHQNPVYYWARDHRLHHKFSETDADPHNSKRGFFFAHVGWLLCRKHPEVKNKTIDLSDLEGDPIVMFQKKYYRILMPLLSFVMPTVIPVYLWNETWRNAYFVSTILRYIFSLNTAWLVNSVGHMFGNRPYDKFIGPSENKCVALLTLGEGWHNYHHVFPWDYRAAELGNYKYNFASAAIDFFARIGWAYDLKTVASATVHKRVKRTGDGTHELWGWGDNDLAQEERRQTVILRHDNKKQ